MSEMEIRMLRHLAGVMAEAAGGIIAILDAQQGPPEPPEPDERPAYFGADETPKAA